MYTMLEHDALVADVMEAVKEAWQFEEQQQGSTIFLAQDKWQTSAGEDVVDMATLESHLKFLMANLYVYNGGQLLQQTKGLPMGVEPAPQLANLACYAREARFAEKMGADWKGWICRFIDDCFVAGEDFPSEEDYGMKYKQTSENTNDLIFIGLRLFKDTNGLAHSALYDRALE